LATQLRVGGSLDSMEFGMSKGTLEPVIGWTMLWREEMRQVERSLSNNEQDTRDEIGFLLIHQGFADRFFPGERMTAALLDRLTNHCEIFEMNGESYRFRESMKQKRTNKGK
jgi:hypothetical protein